MKITATLTRLCNAKCSHCYLPSVDYNKNSKDDLTREQFMKGIENIARNFAGEVEQIKITGGEFLLLSYGTEIVSTFRSLFPNSRLIAYTNGLIFKKKPELFNIVKPDIFHLGIDEWHKTVDSEGRSELVEHFIKYGEKNQDFILDVHWAENSDRNNRTLFNKMKERYENANFNIAFHYSQLGTNRGRSLGIIPSDKFKRLKNDCTLGEDLAILYDNHLYACHWGLVANDIGTLDDENIKGNLEKMKESKLKQILKSNHADYFVNQYLEKDHIKTFYLCNECEMIIDKGIDIHNAAESSNIC